MVAYTALFRAVADFSGAIREGQRLGAEFGKVKEAAAAASLAGHGIGRQVAAGAAASVPAISKLGRTLTLGVSVPVALIGKTAVHTFAEFENQIISAGSKAEATSEQLNQMKDKALEVGQRSKFSATQAAEALDNLAAAGFNANDAMGTLDTVVNAAVATNSDLALTTGVVAKTMNAFAIATKDSAHVADVLASAVNSTSLDMQGLADALGQVGEVNPRFKSSLEDVIAFTGRLVDLGVPAASAGTGIRQAMTFLAAPTGKAAAVMRNLGIEIRDTKGDMLPLVQILENVKKGINDNSAVTKSYGKIVNLNTKDLKAWAKENGTNYQVARALQVAVQSGGAAFKDYATRAIFGVEGAKAFSLAMSEGKPVIIDVNRETQKLDRLTRGLAITMGVKGADAFVKAHIQGGKFVATSVDAVRSVSALEKGSDGLNKQMAAMFQQGTKQKLDNLNSAFETLAIIFVEKIKPGLDRNIERLTAFVNKITEVVKTHPQLVQFAAVFATILASIGPVLFITSRLIAATKILVDVVKGVSGAVKVAVIWTQLYAEAAVKATRANGGWKSSFASIIGFLGRGGPWAIAITAAIAVIALFAKHHFDAKKAQEEAKQAADDFAGAMDNIKGKVTQANAALEDQVKIMAVDKLQKEGAFDLANKLGISNKTLTDYVLGNKDAMQLVNKALIENYAANHLAGKAEAERSNNALKLGRILGKTFDAERAGIDAANQRREALGETSAAEDKAATNAEKLGDANRDLEATEKSLQTKLNDVTKAVNDIIDAFTILRGDNLTTAEMNDKLESGYHDLAKAFKDNGKSIKGNSDAALANRGALFSQLELLNKTATAHFKNAYEASKSTTETGKLKDATKVASAELKVNEDRLRRLAHAAGINDKQFDSMIKQMLLTPDELRTKIVNDGMKTAQKEIDDLKKKITDLKDKIVKIEMEMTFDKGWAAVVNTYHRKTTPGQALAAGGAVQNLSGKGRQAYDTEPAMLRVDEHVWTPEEVDAAGGHKKVAALRKAALDGALHFARGGAVTRRLENDPLAPPAERRGLVKKGVDWQKGQADKAAMALARAFAAKIQKQLNAGPLPSAAVDNPAGLTTFNGGTFTRLFAANLARVQSAIGRVLPVFQGGFRPTSSYSGSTHNKDAIDTAPRSDAIIAFRRLVGAMGDRTGLGDWISHAHGVPAPGHGYPAPSAAAQYQDYLRRGGPGQPLKSPWGLQTGTRNTTLGTHLVGENGPELLRTRGGADITDSKKTLEYLSRIEAMAVRAPERLTDLPPGQMPAGQAPTREENYNFDFKVFYARQDLPPTMALQQSMIRAGREVAKSARGTKG